MESQLQSVLNGSIKSYEDFTLEVFRIISFKPGFHYKMHSHKRVELNYVLKGSCVMMFGNKLVKLNQNNSILISPGSKHDFFVDSKLGVKIVQLEFLLDESFSSLLNLKSSSEPYIKVPNNPEIGNSMERIIKENKLKRNNYIPLSKLYFLELIILLSRVIKRQSQQVEQCENEYMKIAMKRIHSNYSTGVYISDLAKECKISERYLRKLFSVHLESTPQEYCNNLRLIKSVELLADRNIPIKDIAYRIGYSTPQYFSRKFKEEYGFSPQVYRKIIFESQD
jgi:AraC-like DNA-binding protein